ncbi:MAG TPA: histone, partial [Candidatus Nitrosocosmicus sp.]|nr:histone [Candidatus Nitrosocosmicus sp.]
MHRIIKKYGAERVSDSAADELRRILEALGENIAKQA